MLCLLTPTLPWQGLALGMWTSLPDGFAWFTLIMVFGVIPVVDPMVGQDRTNAGDAHARGHYADVGTEADATSARPGEFFYRYFIRLLPPLWRQIMNPRLRAFLETAR
ncbi:MAG: hypothetical protein WDZ63_15930 [Burkholderiales bacterium]